MKQADSSSNSSPHKLLEQVRAFPLEDNLVLFHAPTARYWLLNRLARDIYLALAQGHPVPDLAYRLAQDWDLIVEQAQGAVEATLTDWAGSGLWGDGRWSPEAEHPPPLSLDQLRPTWQAAQVQHFRMWGVVFGLGVSRPSWSSSILPLFHPFAWAQSNPQAPIFRLLSHDGLHYLFCDEGLVDSDTDPEPIMTRLMLEIYLLVLGPQEVLAVFHAGAVVQQNKAWLICGTSGAGKSTLTAALAGIGMPCLNDDTVLLCGGKPNLKALPLAIKLRRPSWELLRPYHPHLDHAPETMLGDNHVRFLACAAGTLDLGGKGHELGGILLPDRTPGQEAGCFRISATEALARLIQGGSWLDPDPGRMGRALDLISRTQAYLLRYSGLEQALALLRERLAP